jgi:hypothetical protein
VGQALRVLWADFEEMRFRGRVRRADGRVVARDIRT